MPDMREAHAQVAARNPGLPRADSSVALPAHSPASDPIAIHDAISCVLVDPSLYTAPYDAALTGGLIAAGVVPTWVTRDIRPGDREEIPAHLVMPLFYRHVDHAPRLPERLRTVLKGLAHAVGHLRMLRLIRRRQPQLVHVQWLVVPLLDLVALWWIRRSRPLVITIHDAIPFNGHGVPLLWRLGFDLPIRLADAVIVHTATARDALIARGIAAEKITVVPHGPLQLHAQANPHRPPRDLRYTFVLFGEIKPYKGVDLLIEAVARLPADLRQRARVIVAGRPRMDIEPLLARIRDLALHGTIEVRAQRLSEQEMADLFADTDCFVFPYRQIDASGVYFLTKSLNKWIIATRVGIFADEIDGTNGHLVPAEAAEQLADALGDAIAQRPAPHAHTASSSWTHIGQQTLAVYRRAIASHRRRALP